MEKDQTEKPDEVLVDYEKMIQEILSLKRQIAEASKEPSGSLRMMLAAQMDDEIEVRIAGLETVEKKDLENQQGHIGGLRHAKRIIFAEDLDSQLATAQNALAAYECQWTIYTQRFDEIKSRLMPEGAEPTEPTEPALEATEDIPITPAAAAASLGLGLLTILTVPLVKMVRGLLAHKHKLEKAGFACFVPSPPEQNVWEWTAPVAPEAMLFYETAKSATPGPIYIECRIDLPGQLVIPGSDIQAEDVPHSDLAAEGEDDDQAEDFVDEMTEAEDGTTPFTAPHAPAVAGFREVVALTAPRANGAVSASLEGIGFTRTGRQIDGDDEWVAPFREDTYRAADTLRESEEDVFEVFKR